jgi:hypothetical protein
MAEPISSSVINATSDSMTDDCTKGLTIGTLFKRTTRIGFIGLGLIGNRLVIERTMGWLQGRVKGSTSISLR